MQFLRLTRDVEIGANCYALRLGGRLMILDAGMHPKNEGAEALPNLGPILGEKVESILVSHAHQDHVGSLPVLTREFEETPVIMTTATARIAETMLHNSVNVMMRKKDEHKLSVYPLFTHRGIDASMHHWRQSPLRRPLTMSGERATPSEKTTIELFDAGHILGSAGALIRHEGKTIFYTGDVNFDDQTLMQGADFPTEGVDTLIMEATRGDSPMTEGWTRKSEEQRFLKAIQDAFERGGSVTVPVFALGKTQEILAMLWRFRTEGTLPHVPIYIGGLSTKLSTVYDEFAASERRAYPDLQLLPELAPYVLAGKEAGNVRPRNKCIYALSSGMMTENTLSNLFIRHILPDPKQSLFFVGYSDPESPAGRLRASTHGSEVVLDAKLPPVPFQCHMESFAFSAHAPRESLLDYAIRLRPKKILLVHGDPGAVAWFQNELQKAIPGTEVVSPGPGVWLDI